MWKSAFGIVVAIAASASAANPRAVPVSVSPHDRTVTLQNRFVRVDYDLSRGTYSLSDKQPHGLRLTGARSRWNDVASDERTMLRTWDSVPFAGLGGKGRTLRVSCRRGDAPRYIVEISLGRNSARIAMTCSVVAGTRSLRIATFEPLVGARVLPAGAVTAAKTLDGYSGALQTEVRDGPYRVSNNNLLLTFRDGRRRRSVVMGGLTYREFCKTASTTSGVGTDRRKQLAKWGRLAGYLDCGADRVTSGDLRIAEAKGAAYTFPAGSGSPWFDTVSYDKDAVIYDVDGLKPGRPYTLGFTWWDHNNDGRRQSVWVEANGERLPLVRSVSLPAWEGRREGPAQISAALPAKACAGGRCRIVFQNDAKAPNAVVSEVWLWDGPVRPPKKAATTNICLGVKAEDPVGRLVDAGRRWASADLFYLDIATADPFEALEAYGMALRSAQNRRPNPYDFPTVCAWYAGVWKTPGAQNHPGASRYGIATTPGLVEEAGKIGESGFLNYSRAAARLVPDNYTTNNPQGWWDDAHWQREGFYVAPFETSRKWGAAMHSRGVLAFTYFQPSGPMHSLDFRESRPNLLLGDDPKRNLDVTKPATRRYLQGVYGAMRGGIDGMMFDYCDELWSREASGGGFADRHVTATAFYRLWLEQAKKGLGPRSWIHERALGAPGHDLALGIADSQRTSGDTDKIDPAMVSRSGLRWYKNRTVIAYDMDSKEVFSSWKTPGFAGTDTDGRRMMLTTAYVAASRLLLANSFREMTPEVLYDLERTFPYPTNPRSARPVDAFVAKGWPQVYDYRVNPGWHQVTLFNVSRPTKAETIRVPLSAAAVDGGLQLSARRRYHVYDFWNDRYVGLIPGSAVLSQTLRPGEARVLSVREDQGHPQVVSTNRHITQGLVDLVGEPIWNPKSMTLTGRSKPAPGEAYVLSIAAAGYVPVSAAVKGPSGRTARLPIQFRHGVLKVSITVPTQSTTRWTVQFRKRANP